MTISLLHGKCHVRKEWEELNYPTPWVYCTHPQISCLVAGPSLKGPNCSIRWTAWLGFMSTALRLQVEREGSPCKSFCWWRGQHSPCSMSTSARIHLTQILVFTEGGADPGSNKINEYFPIKYFVMSVKQGNTWNPRITEPTENLPYHFTLNLGFSQPPGREILIRIIQTYCGCATFWLCDLRQFAHSLEK